MESISAFEERCPWCGNPKTNELDDNEGTCKDQVACAERIRAAQRRYAVVREFLGQPKKNIVRDV